MLLVVILDIEPSHHLVYDRDIRSLELTSLERVREKRKTGAASTAGEPGGKPMSSKDANWLP